MKITDISLQARNKDRVNVSVDGAYRFSLDVFQVGELGLRVGREYTEEELAALEDESVFGKLYASALEYAMMRPRSVKELRDYLWRKTRDKKVRSRKTGEIIDRPGVSQVIADRVLGRIIEKRYVNDETFARYWVENRSRLKGASRRKLIAELRAKGVDQGLIEAAFAENPRDEADDLARIIEKKYRRYGDEQKLIAYLARQGFSYDAIKTALARYGSPVQLEVDETG